MWSIQSLAFYVTPYLTEWTPYPFAIISLPSVTWIKSPTEPHASPVFFVSLLQHGDDVSCFAYPRRKNIITERLFLYIVHYTLHTVKHYHNWYMKNLFFAELFPKVLILPSNSLLIPLFSRIAVPNQTIWLLCLYLI